MLITPIEKGQYGRKSLPIMTFIIPQLTLFAETCEDTDKQTKF